MKTEERNRLGLFAAVVLAALMLASPCLAQSLTLKPPSLADAGGRITARFGVSVEDVPILKGELEDGLALVLVCEVGLYRENDWWLSSRVASGKLTSGLRFDPLKQEYVMTTPGGGQPLRDKDLVKLLEKGWGDVEVALGSWALLEKGQKYSLRLFTSMNEEDAPDGILRYLYFWSWNPGAENSFQLDFTY